MTFEWLYGIQTLQLFPHRKRRRGKFGRISGATGSIVGSQSLLNKLDDGDNDPAVEILLGMIKVPAEERWPANQCLWQGFHNDY